MQKIYNSFLNEEITINERGAELAADIDFIRDWLKSDNTIKDKLRHYLQALLDAYEETQDLERWGEKLDVYT